MLDQDDLHSAVAAGVITPEAAEALRIHLEARKSVASTSEERFRLASGFNDFFVSIAAIILLVAVWALGNALMTDLHNYWSKFEPDRFREAVEYGRYKGLGPVSCAAAAWLLSEYFTKVRRMALPSIVLLVAIVIGLSYGLAAFYYDWYFSAHGELEPWDCSQWPDPPRVTHDKVCLAYQAQLNDSFLAYAVIAPAVAALSWLHWRRFSLPISIAAATASLAASALFLLSWAIKAESLSSPAPLVAILIGGIAIFGYAMWWDLSDRSRETSRSDVAFWLHLLAAPMIAHSTFMLIGVSDGQQLAPIAGLVVLVIYFSFAMVAITVDRRALLVSALAYVLIALAALFSKFGFVQLNFALTALIVGSALLILSAFWNPVRSAIVRRLPANWSNRLPPITAAR